MSYKSAFRDAARALDADRAAACDLLDERRSALYEKHPRLREIEAELAGASVSLAELALSRGENKLSALREKHAALLMERESIYIASGVPADYFTSVYKCAACSDTGYVEDKNGLRERCECLKKRITEIHYGLSNLKNILAAENFETFDLRYYSAEVNESEGLSPRANMQTIYRAVMKFTRDFDAEFQNLLLYGNTGLGKTFLCNCIAKDLLDKGRSVLYLTAPKLFRIVEECRFNRNESEEPDEMLDATVEVDLLILDDLGTEFPTVLTSAALFDLINQRLLSKKSTVISTNLSPPELQSHYSDRINSRFYGYYNVIKFFGEDIRIIKKYGIGK